LLVEGEEANGRLNILPRLGGDTHSLQPSKMNTFAQLVNSDVGRCANQDLTTADLAEMVDDGG
jgi:hypothetical protein